MKRRRLWIVGVVGMLILGCTLLWAGFKTDDKSSKKLYLSLSHMSPQLVKLRLDVKEYLMMQDTQFVFNFEQEAKGLELLFEELSKEASFRGDALRMEHIKALRSELETFQKEFKKIIELEEKNDQIQSTIFVKLNASLEEAPNKILFQSFNDNDPTSGQSAAKILDALLKYKLAVSSYELSANPFYLIRAQELKEEVKKQSERLETVVSNKESQARLKTFKEEFERYAKGFEQLASHIQKKRLIVTKMFEEIVPSMMSHSQTLLLSVEKAL